jgi:hypothetical protein
LQVEANYTTTVNDANYADMSVLRSYDHLLTHTCLSDDDDDDDDGGGGGGGGGLYCS